MLRVSPFRNRDYSLHQPGGKRSTHESLSLAARFPQGAIAGSKGSKDKNM